MPELNHDELDPGRAACRQFDADLPAYLEGEERPRVVAHTRLCPFCAVILADMEQIRFVSRHLALEEPAAKVWVNIRTALAREETFREPATGWHRWLPRFAFQFSAAPVAAMACLTILSLTLLIPPREFEREGTADRLAPSSKTTVATALTLGLDSRLAQTLREMEKSYLAGEMFLEPTLKATYRKSLESLDVSINETLSHCQREPADTLARQYLLSAYQSKAEVLASALEFEGR